jgi:hypothetical protein
MSNKTTRKKRPAAGTRSEPSPWPRRLLFAGGAAFVLLLIAVVLFTPNPIRGIPEGTETLAVGAPEHVDGDIHEEGEVPAGGAHDAVWQNCGFYDTPVRSENAVHSLEHGAVWITYGPALATEEINRLRGFIRRPDKVLISPVPGQDAPITATAWANQLRVENADDSRLEQFVNEFEGSSAAPEPGGACTGGIGTPVG